MASRYSMLELDENNGELDTELPEPGTLEDTPETIPESDVEEVAPSDLAEEATEELEEVTENLEALRDMIASTIGRGGMTKGEAIFAEQAVRLASGRFIKAKSFNVESFDNAQSRLDATKYAMEGVGETLKNVWNKIVAFIKEWASRIHKWFSDKITSLDSVEKGCKQLLELIAKKSVESANEKIKMADAHVSALIYKGQLDKGKGLEFTANYLTHVKGSASYLIKHLKDVATTMGHGSAGGSDVSAEKLSEVVHKSLLPHLKNHGFTPSEEGKKAIATSPELLGGKTIKLVFNEDSISGSVEEAKSSKIAFSHEIEPLTTAEATIVLNAAIKLINGIKTSKAQNDRIESDTKDILKEGEVLSKKLYASDGEKGLSDRYEGYKDARKLLNSLGTTVQAIYLPVTAAQRIAISGVKSAYVYARSSVHNLKDK